MAESTKTNSPPRIMIVDDESDILSVIKRGLESKMISWLTHFQRLMMRLKIFRIVLQLL